MLKWLALIFMTLDHIGFYAYYWIPEPLYEVLRGVGRLAMPIFVYSLVRGYERTHNRLHYFLRLAIFGLAAQACFFYSQSFSPIASVFVHTDPNFMMSLALYVPFLYGLETVRKSFSSSFPQPSLALANFSLGLAWIAYLGYLVIHYNFEYNIYGLLTLCCFYLARQFKASQEPLVALISLSVVNLLSQLPPLFGWSALVMSPLQLCSLLALPLIYYLPQSSRRPNIVSRYFFYVYYPLHQLAIMAILSYWVIPALRPDWLP